jgi:hypothetical protein
LQLAEKSSAKSRLIHPPPTDFFCCVVFFYPRVGSGFCYGDHSSIRILLRSFYRGLVLPLFFIRIYTIRICLIRFFTGPEFAYVFFLSEIGSLRRWTPEYDPDLYRK